MLCGMLRTAVDTGLGTAMPHHRSADADALQKLIDGGSCNGDIFANETAHKTIL